MSAARPEATAQALLAALLEQGRTIHHFSCGLTALSLAGLGLSAVLSPGPVFSVLLACSALLGAVETFLAVRVGFDAAIFRLVAAGGAHWDDVDRGLAGLNLVAEGESRSSESRLKGALRLLRRQGSAAALQGLLVLTACLTQAWP